MKVVPVAIIILFLNLFALKGSAQMGELVSHDWIEVADHGQPFRVVIGSTLLNQKYWNNLPTIRITDTNITIQTFNPSRDTMYLSCEYSIPYQISNDTLYLRNRVKIWDEVYGAYIPYKQCAYAHKPLEKLQQSIDFDSLDILRGHRDDLQLYLRIRDEGISSFNRHFDYEGNRSGFRSKKLDGEEEAQLQEILRDALYPQLDDIEMCTWLKDSYNESSHDEKFLFKFYNNGKETSIESSAAINAKLASTADKICRVLSNRYNDTYASDVYSNYDSIPRVHYLSYPSSDSRIMKGKVIKSKKWKDGMIYSIFMSDSTKYLLLSAESPQLQKEIEVYSKKPWTQADAMCKSYGIKTLLGTNFYEPSKTNVLFKYKYRKPRREKTLCKYYPKSKPTRKWKRKNRDLVKIARWFNS